MATCWEICNCIYYVIIPLDALSRVISLLIKLWQGKKPILCIRSWQEKDKITLSCPYYAALEGLIGPVAEGIVLGYQSWVTAHLGPGSFLFNANNKTSLCATESRSRPKFTENKEVLDITGHCSCARLWKSLKANQFMLRLKSFTEATRWISLFLQKHAERETESWTTAVIHSIVIIELGCINNWVLQPFLQQVKIGGKHQHCSTRVLAMKSLELQSWLW